MIKDPKVRYNLALYYIAQFLTGALFTIPLWVAFERQFLTYSQMALMEASVFVLGFLFEIPSSALADMVGRKKTVLLGWLISALAYIFIGLSNSGFGLILGMCFVGIGGAFVSGADTALIYDFLKKYDMEDYFPKLNVYGNMFYRLSMIMAIYAGGYLASLQLSYGYLVRGVFQFLSLIPFALMIEVPFEKSKITYKAYMAQIKAGFANIINDRYVKDIVIYYSFVGAITWACLYYFNNTFAADAGYSPQGQSTIYTLLYIITTSILLYVTNFTKFVKNTKFVLLAFPIVLIVGLLPGVFASKTSAFFMLLLVILAGGARFSILDGLLNKLLDSKDRATTLSSVNMLANAIFIFLMLVGGQIQTYFSTKLMFSFMGLICLLGVLPYTFVIIRRHGIV